MDDCGGAFTMGAIGGGIFQAIKGFRNSPVVSENNFLWIKVFVIFSSVAVGNGMKLKGGKQSYRSSNGAISNSYIKVCGRI